MPKPTYELSTIEKKYSAYLGDVMNQLLRAELHIKIGKRLNEYRGRVRLGLTFLNATESAHFNSALFHLCNVFDKNPQSVSIYKLFNYMCSNRDIFSRDAYEQRQQNKAAPDLGMELFKKLTNEDIGRDMAKVCELEAIMNAVRDWRNRVHGHRDQRVVFQTGKRPALRAMKLTDIERVIDAIFTILRDYSLAFDCTDRQREWPHEDDVEGVLALMAADQP